jgi:hypothetical protein
MFERFWAGNGLILETFLTICLSFIRDLNLLMPVNRVSLSEVS